MGELLCVLLGVFPRVVCEYLDVSPEDLTKLPPHREVEFSIDLVPVFVDDILTLREEHEVHLHIVLQLVMEHRLYAKYEKCEFWLSKVRFLGHVVSKDGVVVDSSKIEEVQNWEQPRNAFEIRRFLGLTSYYRRFVKDFFALASPLTRLTRKGVKFVWDKSYEKSFLEMKARLTIAPVLVILERDLG
ncbi:uncharacterized protein LOC114269009 [Camellia sinensis]|uniref:uncharacterized protein LOC114269009 n=1 Tax=Camellia sinensis TaxID=4442 RepID=UPI0010364BEA|nr:uncharacterized protein LOC114269009 [Camellia sinensis]